MNPLWGHLIGVVIVLLMMVFIGTWVWAWLPQHGKVFDKLAQMPMQDLASPARKVNSAGDEDTTS